jgi:hypothetical protein
MKGHRCTKNTGEPTEFGENKEVIENQDFPISSFE